MFLVKPFVIMTREVPSCGTVFGQASTGLDIYIYIYTRLYTYVLSKFPLLDDGFG